MIFDSTYWKNDLIKLSHRLEKRYNQKKWSERSLFAVEKEIFIGFYSVRKLIEANEVDKKLKKKKYKLTKYPSKSKINWKLKDYWQRLYDLHQGEDEDYNLNSICNQFIHSYIFSPFVPFNNSLMGFFICSDKKKETNIYYITLKKVVEIFRSVGTDSICILEVTYDKENGKYLIHES